MEIVSVILMITGGILALVGGIWFLVESFRESILWGLGCLLFSPIQLVFLILHWDVAKKPFGYQILGIVLCIGGAILGDPAALSSM